MVEAILGILGLTILLVSWLSEAYQTVKENKAKIPITFALLYLVASILLSLHAFFINDIIFFILNISTGLVALLNIIYYFSKKRSK